MLPQSIQILLIEDDDVDAVFIYQLLQPYSTTFILTRVTDSQMALDALCGTGGKVQLPRPYIILLNPHLSMGDGFVFLRKLRADPDLRLSSVFVISSISSEPDRTAAYQYGIVAYISKESIHSNGDIFVQLLYRYVQIGELFPRT
jgi:CheY-like chemotaxis protein